MRWAQSPFYKKQPVCLTLHSSSGSNQQLVDKIAALQDRSRNRGALAANQHSMDEGEVELF